MYSGRTFMETKRGRFVYNEIFKRLNLTLTYEIHVFNYKKQIKNTLDSCATQLNDF